MFLNPSKCKFMLISRKHNRMNNPPAITVNGQTLETVSTFKYLGLLLSSDLAWTKHIEEYMYAPKQRKFWACYTVNFTSTLTKETLLRLYPLSGPTWSTQYQSGTNTWKKIRIWTQKFACKMNTKNWDKGYNELLYMTNLPSLPDRRLYLKLCSLYKIVHNLSHQIFLNLKSPDRIPAHLLPCSPLFAHTMFF